GPAGPSEETDLAADLLARLVDRLDSAPARAAAAPAARGAPWWVPPLVALALLLGVAAVVWFLFHRGPAGPVHNPVTVQLQNLPHLDDPTVVFILDGKPIDREELKKPITLEPKGHELVAKRDGKEIDRWEFKVSKEETTVQVTPKDAGTPVVKGP